MTIFNRRTILKGVGVSFVLPFLESLIIEKAHASSPPIRTAFIFVPNGINMNHWTPSDSFEFEGILEPISNLKNKINVISGLAQYNAHALGDGGGDHARSASTWLTGVHPRKTSGSNIKAGISFDQILANHFRNTSRFPSLEIGCERGGLSGDCDSGYSCAYSNSISWKTESTPVAKETDPKLAFDRLFQTGNKDEDESTKLERIESDKSILDYVLADAKRLSLRLGKTDRVKLDEYMTGVREIENRIKLFSKGFNENHEINNFKNLDKTPRDYQEHIRLMGDLMILAFQTDTTRVSTFMFANEGSNRAYKMIGVNDGHHELSHHQKNVEKLDALKKINTFHTSQLSYILNKMNSIQEGERTLLENSMIVYGAGICDGDRHNHDDLPILLAGNGGGKIKTGKHIITKKSTPMNNLFLSMADKLNIPLEKFGDSSGKLHEIV